MEISIIVPVYNVEKYLKDCIESLLNQDFERAYEIICINDGSTDESLKILEAYKDISEKIIIINQLNKGAGSARNNGLKNANGKYVMFLDSDDYLKHNKVLSILYEEMEKNDLDFILGDFEYDYEEKDKNYRIKRDKRIKNEIMNGRELYDFGIKTKSIAGIVWSKLYKKEFLFKNNLHFVEGIIYEDMEFIPRVYYLADKVKYIDEVIVMYRQRAGSVMSNENMNKIEDYLVIADSLNHFNEKFNSKTLWNSQLYMYVSMIRKMKHLKDKESKKRLELELKKRSVVLRFIKSNRIKYKLFGILYFFKII